MIRSFGDRRSRELVDDLVVRDFHGVARIAKRKLELVHAAAKLDDLRIPPANRHEKFRGNLKGFYSIRVNDQ